MPKSNLKMFCKMLPKVELHAHLNGSLSHETLTKLQAMRLAAGGDTVTIPLIDDMKSLEECFRLFGVAHSLTKTPEAVRLATREVISEFAADGVNYLELRTTPREVPGVMTKEQYLDAVVEEIVKANSEPLSPLVKLLVSVDRRGSVHDAETALQLTLRARSGSGAGGGAAGGAGGGPVVVGLDLSGDPTRGRAQDFLPVLQKARSLGLRTAVHCAEVENEEETLAILQSGTFDRLGHCTFAAQTSYGAVWAALRATCAPVEACLSSNIKCGTTPFLEKHHFGSLWSAGHPVVLCTDDKGVFTTTLSNELHLAAVHWNLSRHDLWQLSCSAINYSFADDSEKLWLHDKMRKWQQCNEHLFD